MKMNFLRTLALISLIFSACIEGEEWEGGEDNEEGEDGGGDGGGQTTGNNSGGSGSCKAGSETVGPGSVSGEIEGSSKMYPGADCTSCHGEMSVAGTVYTDANGTSPASGVSIQVTDSKSRTVTMTSNSAGNFYTTQPLTPPLTAKVTKNGIEKWMGSSASVGGCNDCHACSGSAGFKINVN